MASKLSLSYPSLGGGGSSLRGLIQRARGLRKSTNISVRPPRDQAKRYSGLLPDDVVNKMLGSEREAYFASPKVQKLLAARRAEERDIVALESTLEKRAFDTEMSVVKEQRLQERLEFDKDKQRYDQDRELVYKWTDLINKARGNGNKALESQLLNQGQKFIGSMPPRQQQLMAPVLRAGPFDPKKEKLRRWEEINPRPQPPMAMQEDPFAFTEQVHADNVWRAQKASYQSGRAVSPDVITSVGEDMYVYAPGGKNPQLMGSEELGLTKWAEKMGSNVGKVLLNGGVKGPTKDVRVGGTKYKANTLLKPFETEPSVEYTDQGPTKEHKEASDLMMAWTMKDETDIKPHPAIETITSNLKSGMKMNEISDMFLKQRYGMNFIIIPSKEVEVDTDWSGPIRLWKTWDGKDETGELLRAVPGERMSFHGSEVYYDGQEMFNGANGRSMGTFEEAEASWQQQTAQEEPEKVPEKLSKRIEATKAMLRKQIEEQEKLLGY